jgi:hypothetical protein
MRKFVLFATLGISGIATAFALAGAQTTGTVSVCATASTPAHTIQVDGTDVSTIPAKTATNCATTTYTVPTVTETTQSTQTNTTTVQTTTTVPVTSTVIVTPPPPPPPATMANIWVDTNGGTCVHSVAAVPYVDAAACGSLNAAYQIALPGDLVLVRDGVYGGQTLVTRSTSGWGAPVTFRAEHAQGATIETTVSGASVNIGGASWITIDGFAINGLQTNCGCGGYRAVGDSTAGTDSHITISDNLIDVGKLNGGGSIIGLYKPQNWTITHNTFGPACCGADAPASPVAITIGKPSAGTNDCAHLACNVVIDHNVFQYSDLRHAQDWPSSGWGPVPEGSCTNSTLCHLDGIHIGGLHGGKIDFNQFLGNDCEGIYIEGGGYNGNDDTNIDIVGNSYTAFNDHCNGGIYVKCNGLGTCGGTWNLGFNEGNDLMTLGTGWTGAEPGTVVNIYGNYTYLNMVGTTGNNVGCMAGTAGNVTVNYQYNVWRGLRGGGGNTPGPCSSTDTVATTPGWVNAGASPSVGLDMHKTGSPGVADNYVPCALLTIGTCPTSDTDGDSFQPLSDAGADQR